MAKAPGVCFYFGTFNPIHNGHLMVAQSALSQFGQRLGFERVVFVPAGNPPHRYQEPDLLEATLRLEMVRRATADNAAFAVSDVEIGRPGKSYTVDTLQALTQQYALPQPVPLIIGADALAQLATWRQPQRLVEMVHFLQAPRPGFDLVRQINLNGELAPLGTSPIDMPPLGISSSWIRQTLATSPTGAEGLRYYLPAPVLQFIRWNGLYT
ncbi:nicotinate-nucleotide adenylyltransferase [Vampirovibrio chlorellavorus]|uniref:nicotinate-nucleotide adenylyltransferase n=1 Tax=Vampirovibrio chlorellavorus TaxID=758823 RepID=UPI0026EB0B62|nr:nicotinate-nucleotide adenylyltransferase [Vampirovibrio chlorellavorus]